MENLALNTLLKQIRLQSVGHDCLQANEDQFEMLKAHGVDFLDREPSKDDIEKAEGDGSKGGKLVRLQKVTKSGKKNTYWVNPNKDKESSKDSHGDLKAKQKEDHDKNFDSIVDSFKKISDTSKRVRSKISPKFDKIIDQIYDLDKKDIIDKELLDNCTDTKLEEIRDRLKDKKKMLKFFLKEKETEDYEGFETQKYLPFGVPKGYTKLKEEEVQGVKIGSLQMNSYQGSPRKVKVLGFIKEDKTGKIIPVMDRMATNTKGDQLWGDLESMKKTTDKLLQTPEKIAKLVKTWDETTLKESIQKLARMKRAYEGEDKKFPDHLQTKLDIQRKELNTRDEEKEKSPEEYDTVRQWSGDEIKDEHIESVIDALKEASTVDGDLKIKNPINQEQESEFVDDKVDELYEEIRPGTLHKDLTEKKAKEILWGMVMAKRGGSKFFVNKIPESE